MKKMILIMLLFIPIMSCKQDKVDPSNQWLDQLIVKGSDNTGKYISVYSYQYKGNLVYLINYEVICCDKFTAQLFDIKGNSICYPYGGITGNGDNRCNDFDLNKTNEKLYWKLGK